MHSPILVLGMHRSGTSALAGSLERAGLYLGPVNQKAAFNKLGNREHEAIRDVHDSVLAHSGFSWDRPPAHILPWPEQLLEELRDLTGSMSDRGLWGVKDPRTVWCLHGWRQLFSLEFVVSYRHPVAVAESLQRRARVWNEDLSIDHAYYLWNAYNSAILRETQGTSCSFIRFDQSMDQYLAGLQRIATNLGLDEQKVTEFFSANLRSIGPPKDDDVPHVCSPIWDELQKRAYD